MTNAVPSIELDHVAIIVRDMDRMIAFYNDIFGLAVIRSGHVAKEVIETLSGDAQVKARFAFLGSGQSAKIEFGEFQPGGEKPENADRYNTIGIRHIAFKAADLRAIEQRLSASEYPNDLRIEEVAINGGASVLKRGLMCDPEGNTIELIEAGEGDGPRRVSPDE